jgi:hypothetical protein
MAPAHHMRATRIADQKGRSLLARTNKLSGNQTAQEPATKLLETVIEDVINAAAMSSKDWLALSQFPLTPLAIPVGPGREYRVTQAGVDAAHKLTERTWRAREDFRQTISRAEFDKLSFAAIGETILNCRAHLPSDAKDQEAASPGEAFYAALAADYAGNLDRLADRARPDVDSHIPCRGDQLLVEAFLKCRIQDRRKEIDDFEASRLIGMRVEKLSRLKGSAWDIC